MKPGLKLVTSVATLVVIAAGLSLGFPGLAVAADCDVDSDGDVDRLDVKQIVIVRNTRASGPDDPRDADGDGNLTMLDARACIRQCTLPNCTIVGTPGDDTSRAKPPPSTPLQPVPRAATKPGPATQQSNAGSRSGTITGAAGWRVKSGDTLYGIGRAIFPADTGRQAQLRQDIVRLNPSVFANGANNMGIGVVLKLPDYVIPGSASPREIEVAPVVKPMAVEAAPEFGTKRPAPAGVTEPKTKTPPAVSTISKATVASEPAKKTAKEKPKIEQKTGSAASRAKGGFVSSLGFSYGGDEVVAVDSGFDILAGSGAQLRLGYEQLPNRGSGYRIALGLQYNMTFGGSEDASVNDTYLQLAYQYRADDLVYGIGVIAQSGARVENDADESTDFDAANGFFLYLENLGKSQFSGWGLSYTAIELDEKDSGETADASRAEIYYSWRF